MLKLNRFFFTILTACNNRSSSLDAEGTAMAIEAEPPYYMRHLSPFVAAAVVHLSLTHDYFSPAGVSVTPSRKSVP